MRCLLRQLPVLVTLLLLQSCATAPKVMVYFPNGEAPEERISWPGAPETARLEYAGVLIGESNFINSEGARDGAGIRFLRWVAGVGGRKREARQLLRPQSGVVDKTGRILVTDAGRQEILVFDELQSELLIWNDAGIGGTFQSPVGIAVRKDGHVLVADADLGYVVVLSPEGTAVMEFGGEILQRPTGVAINPDNGEIFVSDTVAHNIKVFSNSGSHIRTIGTPGTAPGEFNGPTHLKFDGGRLFATDTFNARVQMLTAAGEPLAQLGQRGLYVGNLVRPKGVTTDSDGNVYIVESYYDHILIFDSSGNLLLPIGGTGSASGQFFLPAGIWSDSTDRIFVADMFNGRVIILRYLRN